MKRTTSLFLLIILALLPLLASCTAKAAQITQTPTVTELPPTRTVYRSTARVTPVNTTIAWNGSENQPQEAIFPTETVYSERTATATPRTSTPSVTPRLPSPSITPTRTSTVRPFGPTQTPTKTSTQQTGWAGEWVIYYGYNGEELDMGSMTVTMGDETFTAEAAVGGLNIILAGTLFDDLLQASGTYTHQADSGWFYWKMVSDDQFGGTTDNQLVFCAHRPGGERPDPCGIYPSS